MVSGFANYAVYRIRYGLNANPDQSFTMNADTDLEKMFTNLFEDE
jgi:hypothetical protein